MHFLKTPLHFPLRLTILRRYTLSKKHSLFLSLNQKTQAILKSIFTMVNIFEADNFKLGIIGITHVGCEHSSYLSVTDQPPYKALGLGPRVKSLTNQEIANYQHAARIPPLAFRETLATFLEWVQENSNARIGKWPKPSEEEIAWYRQRRSLDLRIWQDAQIADAIDMCFALKIGGGNRAPIIAAACFWNTSSNTFDLPFGQLGIPLLDVHAITGLPIAEKQFCLSDYVKTIVAHKALRHRPDSYKAWVEYFSARQTPEASVAFLELWLAKYVVCCGASKVTNHWSRIAELLYQGEKIYLLAIATGFLYRGLYHLTIKPFKYSTIAAPFWILGLWLQTSFKFFRHPRVDTFPERDVMGMAFANASPFTAPSFLACCKHLFSMEHFPEELTTTFLKRRYPNALADGFMWDVSHPPEGMLLFAQSLALTDLILIAPYKRKHD